MFISRRVIVLIHISLLNLSFSDLIADNLFIERYYPQIIESLEKRNNGFVDAILSYEREEMTKNAEENNLEYIILKQLFCDYYLSGEIDKTHLSPDGDIKDNAFFQTWKLVTNAIYYDSHVIDLDSSYSYYKQLYNLIGNDDPLSYFAISNLAKICSYRRSVDEGMIYLKEQLQYFKSKNQFEEITLLITQIGRLESYQGDFNKARYTMDKADSLSSIIGTCYYRQHVLSELAIVGISSNNLGLLDSMILEISDLVRYNNVDSSNLCRLRGHFFYLKKEYSLALIEFGLAIEMYDKNALFSKHKLESLYIYRHLCNLELGHFDDALRDLTGSAKILSNGICDDKSLEECVFFVLPNFQNVVRFYNRIANVHLRRGIKLSDIGSVEKAHELYMHADSVVMLMKDFIVEDRALRYQFEAHEMYDNAIEACNLLFALTGSYDYLNDQRSLMSNGSVLLFLNDRNNFDKYGKDQHQEEILRLERTLRTDLVRSNLKNNSEKLEVYSNLVNFKSLVDSLFPEYYEKRYYRPVVSIDEVVKYSEEHNSNILQFYTSSRSIYMIVVSGNYVNSLRMDKSVLESCIPSIDEIMRRSCTAIDKSSVEEVFGYLYDIIIEPFDDSLQFSNFLIIRDDIVKNVPFDILMKEKFDDDKHKCPFLLCYGEIIYSYNLEITIKMNDEIHAGSTKDVMGYSFSSRSSVLNNNSLSMPELAGALLEVEYIENSFTGMDKVKCYYSDQTDKSELLLELTNPYRIAHFATHSFSNEVLKDDNYLVINSNESKEAKLYGYELYESGVAAHSVVLSSCSNNRGKYNVGEGVFSLTRDFLKSGAKEVLATENRVNDKYIYSIVRNMYNNYLNDNTSNDISLSKDMRIAKLSKFNSASFTEEIDVCWANFVIYQ